MVHVSVCVVVALPKQGGVSQRQRQRQRQQQRSAKGEWDGGKALNKPSKQQPENGRASPGAKGEQKKPERRGVYGGLLRIRTKI